MWFNENLEAFVWDVPPPQPHSPMLEADCLQWDFSQVRNSLFPTAIGADTLSSLTIPMLATLHSRL